MPMDINLYPIKTQMFKRKTNVDGPTKKELCQQFYDAREGEKISFSSFYQLYRKNKGGTMEDMIQHKKVGPKKKRYLGRWAEELKWLDFLSEPKADKARFRNRLRDGYSKEEAVLTGEAREKVKAKKQKNVIKKVKVYTPKYVIKKEDESASKIDITYPSEVAKVFRREYILMIEKLENELCYADEKSTQIKITSEIDKLKNELEIFNQYNK